MTKINPLHIIAFLGSFFLFGCEQRRDFCDCMDLTKAMTDGFTLSKKEMEAKTRGCEWIDKELSQVEMMQRLAQCYKTKTDKNQPITNTNQQSTQEMTGNTSPVTNISPNKEIDLEITPNDQNTSSNETYNIQHSEKNDELKFIFNWVHKKTKDVGLLNNITLRKRLQILLGSRFTELQNIYDNSENKLIWIPYKKYPNEIEAVLLDLNDPNGTNATIVINPNKNLINIGITMNNRTDWFLENGIKTGYYIDVIESYENLKKKLDEQ